MPSSADGISHGPRPSIGDSWLVDLKVENTITRPDIVQQHRRRSVTSLGWVARQ